MRAANMIPLVSFCFVLFGRNAQKRSIGKYSAKHSSTEGVYVPVPVGRLYMYELTIQSKSGRVHVQSLQY